MKSNIQIVRDYLDGVRPFVQVGYVGEKNKFRSEGEKWEDSDGIEWERKDGKNVRLTKTQAEIIRELINDKCKCGQVIRWGSKLDIYFFGRTGLCETCLIEYETKLRILGIYPDYEKYKLLSYEVGTIRDICGQIEEAIKFFSQDSGDITMLCNSDGFIERWQNTNKEKILEDSKLELEAAQKRLDEVTKLRDEYKEIYKSSVEKFNLNYYV